MIRLTGMASGLDTESMITDLMKGYNTQKQKKVSTMTKYSWKMDAWSALNKKVNDFYSKSLSNMRFSSAYKSKKCTVSDSTKASVTASNEAVVGSQTLAVKQLAQSGYLTGGKIAKADNGKIKTSTKLSDIGITDATSITVTVNGKAKLVKFDGDTTVAQFTAKLQDAGVNANFDATNQRFFISAKESGYANDFNLTADNAASIDAMTKLGIYSSDDAKDNKDYKTWSEYDLTKNADGSYADATVQAMLEKNTVALQQSYQKVIDKATADKEKAEADKTKNEELLTGHKDQLHDTDAYKDAKSTLDALTSDDYEAYGIKDEDSEDEKLDKIIAKQQKDINSQISDIDNQIKALSEDDPNYETDKAALEAQKTDLTAKKSDVDNAVSLRKQIVKEEQAIATADETITKNSDAITENQTKFDNAEEEARKAIEDKVATARQIVGGDYSGSVGAVRLKGQDAEIFLNGAKFTNTKNSFDINGLSITATEITGLTEEAKNDPTADPDDAKNYNTVSLSTDIDVDAVYKSIKSFITSYNDLIKEMDTLYNAESAKDYEVLSDEEKDAMSDSEVEAWEKKIKDSLLRRDSTLDSVAQAMRDAMASSFKIDGQKYSLQSFGIETLSYFLSGDNEKSIFHIDGDADDEATSANSDKLKKAIANDPEKVQNFFTKLANNMYSVLQKKMQTNELSSTNTIYNDKQMTSQYSTYKTALSNFEDKLAKIEDKYYKQFSAMEKALTTLQSSTSSLASLFGGGN